MTGDQRRTIEWECSRLINLYANLVDAGRWEEVAALYAPAGMMTRPSAPDRPIRGREAILATFRARPARIGRHFCANIVVEVDSPAAARAESRILLFTGTSDEDDGLPELAGLPLVGTYHDRFVLAEEGWRFSERRGSLSFKA